jgi:hypothetical protein
MEAEWAEAASHLATTCQENNTIRKKKEIFSEVWKKSAAVDSAEPNSKRILPRLCQELSMPRICQRQDFVHANILLTPIFCRHEYFVDAKILSMPRFC